MRRRDYRDYPNDIIDSIEEIESFTKDIAFNDFLKDKEYVKRGDKEHSHRRSR